MIAAIVAASGEPAARITTLGAWVAGEAIAREATSEAFLRTVERAVARSVSTLVVETTSQALSEGFADMWPARVGVFTNLTQDHLDLHGDPEGYLAAKAQLFMKLEPGGAAVLNAADPSSALLAEVIPASIRRLAYAGRPADPACRELPLALSAERVEVGSQGTRIALAASPLADRLGGELVLPLFGQPYAENALAAAVAADALGYAPETIRRALETFEGVPGRFQIVHRRPLVVLDYAHTPDALARTLALARQLVAREGRVVCVFGCGGDRDRSKRAEMGRIAAAAADLVVVTSDNPRSEDPVAIADMVVSGMEGSSEKVRRMVDRAGAIELGIGLAGSSDLVLIAGKGHEEVQIGAEGARPFNDAEVARAILARRKEGGDEGRS